MPDEQKPGLGCYYFQTHYPATIACPADCVFQFTFEGRLILALIREKWKGVLVNDLSNRIFRIDNNGELNVAFADDKIQLSPKNIIVGFDQEQYFILDYNKHQHKEIYTIPYTEILVSFETNDPLEGFELGKRVLNYFIESYRGVSQDILTLPKDRNPFYSEIYRYSFHEYSPEELLLDQINRMKIERGLKFQFHETVFPFWEFHGRRLRIDEKALAEKLQIHLTLGKRVGFISDVLLRASEELNIRRNYKYAFIECWTGMEVLIDEFTTNKKKALGVSKNKVDSYPASAAYQINIELPIFLEAKDSQAMNIIQQLDIVRKKRNDIIHRNQSVTEEEARNAFETLHLFLKLIEYKE